jgi:hypothetical protein
MFDTAVNFANEQRAIIHLLLHVLIPLIFAWLCAPQNKWKIVFVVMLATMLVDIDHLLATPIYEPNRCSILFHPLHQILPIVVYFMMALWPLCVLVLGRELKRIEFWFGWLGLGLLIHMLLDGLDCVWMRFGQ